MKKIIFIEYGQQERYRNQVKYAVMTLHAHNQLDKSEIVIYSETPELYSDVKATAISIKAQVDELSLNGRYHFRVKPCIILSALEEYQCPVLFLDTDTFCNSNLTSKISSIKDKNILMNIFEKTNPYPDCNLTEATLPSGKVYSYDTQKTQMYNSGVVGVNPSHASAIRDAISIIDAMKLSGVGYHTIEQTALSESFRIHGIKISELNKEITHYTRGTGKDYMDDMIRKNMEKLTPAAAYPEGKFIPFSWFRPRFHKAIKKLRASWQK